MLLLKVLDLRLPVIRLYPVLSLLSVVGSLLLVTGIANSRSCYASQLIRNLRAGLSQTVVTYGTSLTRPGVWPDQLGTWLTTKFPGQVQLINRGIPSSASQHVNPFLDALAQLDARVLAFEPDTVFLEFAVNDALTGNTISLQRSRDNLNIMIDRILADRADREIVLMTMNPAWDPPGAFAAATARPDLAQYYQGYRDVAAARGLILIDHHVNWVQLSDTNRSLFEQSIPDGIHPTPEALMQIVTPENIRSLTIPEPTTGLLLQAGIVALMNRYLLILLMRGRHNLEQTPSNLLDDT